MSEINPSCKRGHAMERNDQFCGSCGAPRQGAQPVVTLAAGLGVGAWITAMLLAVSVSGSGIVAAASRDTEVLASRLAKTVVTPAEGALPEVQHDAVVQRPIQTTVTTVYGTGTIADLLMRWSMSSATFGVPSLRIAPLATGGFALVTSETQLHSPGEVRTNPLLVIDGLAAPEERNLGALSNQSEWLQIRPLRIRISVNLREGPTKKAAMLTALPADAVVVAALGRVGDQASALGKASWAFVVAGSSLSGWLWTGEATVYSECLPYRATSAWAGGEDWRVAAHGTVDALSFLAIKTTGERSTITRFASDSKCTLQAEQTWNLSGMVEQAYLVALDDGEDPDALFASSMRGPSETEWSAFRGTEPDPFWSMSVPAFPDRTGFERVHGDGPHRTTKAEPGYFPLRLRWPGEKMPHLFRWNGSKLEEVGGDTE